MCEAVGADINDVVLGMGYDSRIGHEFLRPGPGWGGCCFPKDTRALVRIAEDAGYDFDLLKGVVAVNEEQFERVADKVEAAGRRIGRGQATIAAWGLTFKARTDDLRESPSLAVIGRLRDAGRHGPGLRPGESTSRSRASRSSTTPTPPCEGADVLVVLTEWDEFRWLDFDKVADAMAAKHVVDARNLLDRAALQRRGFEYRGHRSRRAVRSIGIMARVVVTGGAGFLGSHLCRRAARPRRRGRRHRQPHHRLRRQHRAPLRHRRASRSSTTT